jgi:hypothetical protein
MLKKTRWALIALIVGMSIGSSASRFESEEGFPIPYSSLNQRVELAHGENYTLAGEVHCIGDKVYFQVDFDLHPWLKNKSRELRRYYPLSGGGVDWHDYRNRRIQIFVRARSMIYRWRGSYRHEIALDSIFEPSPIDELD